MFARYSLLEAARRRVEGQGGAGQQPGKSEFSVMTSLLLVDVCLAPRRRYNCSTAFAKNKILFLRPAYYPSQDLISESVAI